MNCSKSVNVDSFLDTSLRAKPQIVDVLPLGDDGPSISVQV
jgi:hypothetical protein